MAEGLFASFGRFLRSPAFKLALIGVLVLLLGAPLLSVWALVGEREGRSREAASDIARSWGGQQTVTGPFLIVPYSIKVRVVNGDKQIEETQGRLGVFLPDKVNIGAKTASQVLHLSLIHI